VFIFSFFTGSIIRVISGIILLLILLLGIFAVVVGSLAATGGPSPCTPGGGPITVDAGNSAAFQQKWDAMDLTLDGGTPASATFNESEISSRANTYLDEHDVGFSEPRVCIYDGEGEGTATFSFLGIDVKVSVRGTMDLTGDHPDADIDEMEVGNVPGFLLAPIEGAVNSAIDSALDDIDLDHTYGLELTPGQAGVSGTP
jgi:hypothetical protein